MFEEALQQGPRDDEQPHLHEKLENLRRELAVSRAPGARRSSLPARARRLRRHRGAACRCRRTIRAPPRCSRRSRRAPRVATALRGSARLAVDSDAQARCAGAAALAPDARARAAGAACASRCRACSARRSRCSRSTATSTRSSRAESRHFERGPLTPDLLWRVAGLALRPDEVVDVVLGGPLLAPDLALRARLRRRRTAACGSSSRARTARAAALELRRRGQLRELDGARARRARRGRARFDDYAPVAGAALAHRVSHRHGLGARAVLQLSRRRAEPLAARGYIPPRRARGPVRRGGGMKRRRCRGRARGRARALGLHQQSVSGRRRRARDLLHRLRRPAEDARSRRSPTRSTTTW